MSKPVNSGSLSCREAAGGKLVFWCDNSTSLPAEIYESFESEKVEIQAENTENISSISCLGDNHGDGGEGKTANVWYSGLDNDTGNIMRSGSSSLNAIIRVD